MVSVFAISVSKCKLSSWVVNDVALVLLLPIGARPVKTRDKISSLLTPEYSQLPPTNSNST
jgi:hypothetical protein